MLAPVWQYHCGYPKAHVFMQAKSITFFFQLLFEISIAHDKQCGVRAVFTKCFEYVQQEFLIFGWVKSADIADYQLVVSYSKFMAHHGSSGVIGLELLHVNTVVQHIELSISKEIGARFFGAGKEIGGMPRIDFCKPRLTTYAPLRTNPLLCEWAMRTGMPALSAARKQKYPIVKGCT